MQYGTYIRGLENRPAAKRMAEYALILLAILIVVIAGYQVMGTTLKAEVVNIDGEM